MVHPGDFGGNTARPNIPLDHLTPSFPSPATIGAPASQALFQDNQSVPFIGATCPPWFGHPAGAHALVPPAVAPQFPPPVSHPRWTMPQAGDVPNASPFQPFGAAAVQTPLRGEELAARVAAINMLPSHGWPQPLPPPPPPPTQQQAPLDPPRNPALQPVDATIHNAVWGQPLAPPPQDVHFLQWPTVAMAPNGNNIAAPAVNMNSYGGGTSCVPPMLPPDSWPMSWAPPPVQQSVGQASWTPPSQRPGAPAASPAIGSARAHPQAPGKKTFEEFLLEAGVLDKWTVDDILLEDDVVLEDLVNGLLVDGPAELNPVPVEGDGLVLASAGGGGGLVPGPGAGSSSGPNREQAGLCEVPGAGAMDVCRRDREAAAAAAAAAAAEARERRSRRMAMRKRPEKLAGARGSKLDTRSDLSRQGADC